MKLQGSAKVGFPIALGLIAALLFLSLIQSIAHAAILGFLAPMPLMIAALGLGTGSAALAGLVGAVACGAVAGVPFGVSFLGIGVLPAILMANRALRHTQEPDGKVLWYPVGHALAWLTVALTAVLLLWVGALPHHDGGIRGWLDEFLSQALDMLGDQVEPTERLEITRLLSATLPAIIAGVWMVMAAVNAMIAQAILSWSGQGLRPSPDYLGMELPDWLVLLPLGAGLVWVVTGGSVAYVAANVVMIGLMPYSALGIALIHRWLAVKRQGVTFGFLAFYGALMLFSIWALIPLAMVGLVRFVRSWIIRQIADKTEG